MKTQKQSIRKFIQSIAFATLFLLSAAIQAQDRITLKNGDEINATISEVTDTEVKYKTYGNENGPIRVVYISNIFSIKYANGTKELFENRENQIQPTPENKPSQPAQYGAQRPSRSKYDSDTSDYAKKKRKNFSGPRVGVTYIAPGTTADYLSSNGKNPFITQFGWQFETRLFTIEDGTSGLVEFIPMIGGVEQALFLPSASFLLGLRGGTNRSWEFAIGPSLGVKYDLKGDLMNPFGLVVALGTSLKKGNVWFPINLAFTPSVGSKQTIDIKDATGVVTGKEEQKFNTGWKLSLIVGFNSRVR